jgi:flagellar motility protein MotE (MotC chaperone)
MLTALAAASAAVANGVTAVSPAAKSPASSAPKTRLGVSIGQELGTQDQVAARRKRALDLREQAARAAEGRLKGQLEAQQQSPEPGQGRDGAGGRAGSDQYDDLARIYQSMKPAKAAAVFEQLDLDVQMKVAQKMRERSTAMILGSMTPRAAATLSMALARRSPVRPRPAPAPVSAVAQR